jgi:ABC-2 type transport system permease protein
VLFMSTAVMPAELLPDWLASIAEWNPISYVADAMRAANGGSVDGSATWKALVGIGVVASVTQLLVVRARRSIEKQQ